MRLFSPISSFTSSDSATTFSLTSASAPGVKTSATRDGCFLNSAFICFFKSTRDVTIRTTPYVVLSSQLAASERAVLPPSMVGFEASQKSRGGEQLVGCLPSECNMWAEW